MRRVSLTSALAALLLFAVTSGADLIVLKDGRTIETSGPPVLKGRMAVLKTPDGKLFSIPADQIDRTRTEAARLSPTPVPTPAPAVGKGVPTPAEIAGKKSGRRASVVLTDEDVAGGTLEAEPEQREGGEERVEVAAANVSRTPGGYAITGSVINAGKVEVDAVGVTIEAIGGELKTVATTYGQVAKDSLAPGEKSTFTAQLKESSDVASFRYTARWRSKAPVKAAPAAGQSGEPSQPEKPAEGAEASGKSEGGPSKPAAPRPTPTPTFVRVPLPDVAPPPPNAPIGAPEKPGGTFLPKPTGDQPKPPDGG